MKIIITDTVPIANHVPFAIYEYNEKLTSHQNYIDIRGIVRKHCWQWLDEINNCHSELSANMLNYTKYWWLTEASRLNIQTWGQGPIFKPLFFSIGIMEWIKFNNNQTELHIVSSSPLIKKYLLEFNSNLNIIDNSNRKFKTNFADIFLKFAKEVIAFFRNFAMILRFHVFVLRNTEYAKVLIMSESIDSSPSKGRYYFYGDLFNKFSEYKDIKFSYVCTNIFRNQKTADRSSQFSENYLLDNIKLIDLVKSTIDMFYLYVVTLVTGFKKIKCTANGLSSHDFWKTFLLDQFSLNNTFINICCNRSLINLLNLTMPKSIIIQYEEKSRERAIIMASKEKGCNVTSYICHPMHRSLIALKDKETYSSPKPDKYGVAGHSFIGQFSTWANKPSNQLSLWGSGKNIKPFENIKMLNRSNLKILLLVSHPDEIKVFHSWLKTDKSLTVSINYFIRYYKVVPNKVFKKTLDPLINEFNVVHETNGNLVEDLKNCQLVVFCSTSAGINAILYGYIAIYIELNEFFKINPCFDKLETVLPCETPLEFSNLINKLCEMDIDKLSKIYNNQKRMALNLFSQIHEPAIRDELFGN